MKQVLRNPIDSGPMLGDCPAVIVAVLLSISCAAFAADRDFNGDLRADVLWRHEGAGGTGQNYIYPMNGTEVLPAEGFIRTVGLDWEVAGIGDLDGDGEADILWRNQATGQNYVFFMAGTTIANEGFMLTVADPTWKVAAIADFDGDSRSDILWRNSVSGENYIHTMNGLNVTANEGYVRTVVSQDWRVAGTGDFNGDGKADILWRNSASGENYIYPMNGTQILPGEGFIRTVVDMSWTIAGIGDFDGDGKSDILWRNTSSGENYIYPMDGLNIKVIEGYIRTVPDQSWQVASVGDFDGNTSPVTADILWRNVSTGHNYLYPMNGTTVLATEGYVRTVATDWTVQPARRKCPAISNGAISLSAVASRTSGVAPLAVFFDATGTTATATTRPFHDLEYRWDFGDEASGFWTSTPNMPNLRRNLATGPVAAHVFETPGTYTVCATAFDGVNTVTTSIDITVTDPDTEFAGSNTRCIRAQSTGDFSGCPVGATQITNSDFDAVFNSNIGMNRRLLFRRGDTFVSSADANITVNGPGLVGAFGSGNSPIVSVTGNNNAIQLSDQDTPNIADWRIMDLEINGNGGNATNGVYAEGNMNRFTLLRLNIHDVHVGVRLSPFLLDAFGHPMWDQVAVVDSTISTLIGGSGGNGMYVGASRFALLGNVITNSTGAEHILRTPNIYKGVISHNNLNNPASAKHVVKLQAAVFDASPTDASELIVISDNKFTAGTGAAWNVTIGPQDTVENEVVRNVIVERNWFAPHSGQQVALMVWAQDVTVRNNVFNVTGASDRRGMIVDRRGVEPPPQNVHVYNNTFYSGSSGNFIPVAFSTGTGMIAKNNLGYAPISTSRDMVSGTAIDEGNTTDAGILQSPDFASANPSEPMDFALGAASSAANVGVAVPVHVDFARRSRPHDGQIDRGAFERH